MKISVRLLEGHALDYAVAIAEGWVFKTGVSTWFGNQPWLEHTDDQGVRRRQLHELAYSSDPHLGYGIVEREHIDLQWNLPKTECFGTIRVIWPEIMPGGLRSVCRHGPTPLIAAMRCFVVSKLGNEIDIPEFLT